MDGREIPFRLVPVQLMNISEKWLKKMQGNPREPLRVTQEAVDAYEQQTGFHGIGKIMVEHGAWVIVPYEGVVQPKWRSVENSGPHLPRAVASHRSRANPATIGLGGSS